MRMNNRWNRFIYRLWAPVYDGTVDRFFFRPARARAIQALALQPGETVLLVGVGTGADLPLLPAGARAVGVDLSPHMLAKAREKLARCAARASLVQGDAQALPMADACADAVLLSLILSVVPDGAGCLRDSLRTLKPGGRAVVFDKFEPSHGRPSALRRWLNVFSTVLGTDIMRRFGDLSRCCACAVVRDEPSLGGGLYRVIELRKT